MRMLFILPVLLITSCNKNNRISELEKENQKLKKEIIIMKDELLKCEMMLEAYEGYPLSI